MANDGREGLALALGGGHDLITLDVMLPILDGFEVLRQVRQRSHAEAEQTRFDVGMSTNDNVVIAQNNLTTQRLAELRAIIAYLNAIAEFDRIQRVGR